MSGKTLIATLVGETLVPATYQPLIAYVGGQVGGRAGATTTLDVNFALTGGLASVPAAGDLVIITVCVGSAARDPACAITNPSGYTAYGQLNSAAATNDTSQDVSYKFMGGTPDTLFTLPSSGNTADAQRYTVQVFRNVDPTTPNDAASTTATGSATGRPDPASITPVTAGAWVVICGSGAAATGASYVAPANFATNFLTGSSADTTDAMVGSGYWTGWTSGAVDPATFTGGTTNAADSWVARTIALRPAPATAPFDDARAAIRDGITSAQSEAAGWNAKVRPNIPLGNIVRTSNNVVTVTLQAQADYDITAQETITWTLPASSVVGGLALVATPSFTVDTAGGATAIDISDLAVGSHAIVVDAASVLADLAVGAHTLIIDGSSSITEPATGADAVAISAQISITDSSTGADSIQLELLFPDSAVGLESVQVEAAIGSVESAVGSEGITLTLPISDSAAGADITSVDASTLLDDTSVGADGLNIENLAFDTAIGVDDISIIATLLLQDAAVGGELPSVDDASSIPVESSDPGTGSEAIEIEAQALIVDSASGIDDISTSAIVSLLDAAVGFEAMGLEDLASDSATGADSVQISALIALVDIASGAELIDTGDAPQSREGGDDAVGVDALTLTANIDFTDSAQGFDQLLKGFLPPPLVSGPNLFDLRGIFSPDELPLDLDYSTLDRAKGADAVSIEALVIARDKAKGFDKLSVEKHYPQLEAFHHRLLAAYKG